MISPLSCALSLVGHVRQHVPAAAGIARDGPPIRRRGQHLDRRCERHALLRLVHARRDPLTRDGAPHEHDLPMVTREHASAGGGFLDVEREDGAGLDHSNVTRGSPRLSRRSRSPSGTA